MRTDADGLLGFDTFENSSDEVIHNRFDQKRALGSTHFPTEDEPMSTDAAAEEDGGSWPSGSVLQQPLSPLATIAGACLRAKKTVAACAQTRAR